MNTKNSEMKINTLKKNIYNEKYESRKMSNIGWSEIFFIHLPIY